MINVVKYSFLLGIIILINGCILFKKEIKKPTTISLTEIIISPELNSTAELTKYINGIDQRTVLDKFISSFKNEGQSTKNITLTSNDANADYTLKLVSLKITETSRVEKINNPKSEYNGQNVVLNSIECSVNMELKNNKNNSKTIRHCYNSKVKSEKLSNNRNLSDIISGSNKDNSVYHVKTLLDNVCLNLTEDVGRRIWVPITKKIARDQK